EPPRMMSWPWPYPRWMIPSQLILRRRTEMTTTQNDMQSSPAPAPTSRRTNAIGRWMLNNGALVGLILLCIGLFIATPHFLTVPNLINIGIQASVVAILAFGMTFVIVTAGIDLSVGSVAALGAVVSAYSFASL